MFLTHTTRRQDKTSEGWSVDSFASSLYKRNGQSVSANILESIKGFEFPVMFEFPNSGNALDILMLRFDLRELSKMKRA
jgi:hypothetical protein